MCQVRHPKRRSIFTFPGFKKHHEIPIFGLYAETLNHVLLRMETENGLSDQTEIDLQTEPLPGTMPVFQIDLLDADHYSPGFNFAFLDTSPVFDLNGDIRWYSKRMSKQVFVHVFTRLQNGKFLFAYSTGDEKQKTVLEEDLLGKVYTIYYIVDGIHHDIFEMPNGNLLVTSSDLKSDTVEDFILEVDRSNGHIVKSYDFKKYLDEKRPHEIGIEASDWLHLNSIIYDPVDRSIILSSRSQSAVIKMSYPEMKIKWILGPHENWSEKYQAYLLTPNGDNFEWSWSQHHATILTPRNPDTNIVDILLFDNGQYRSFDLASAYSPPESYSRMVYYRINETAMTIEQEWEYGKERGASLFSAIGGSAYQLDNGNLMGTWGSIARNEQGTPIAQIGPTDNVQTRIVEVNPATSEVIFESTVPDLGIYRVLRGSLYDGVLEENAFLSTRIKDYSANDLYDRSIMAWKDVKRWLNPDPLLLQVKRLARKFLTLLN